MNTAPILKLCSYFTWLILNLAACIAVADEYVTDANVQALANAAAAAGKDHINIQIWVDQGSALGSPGSSRIKIHINGSTVGSGAGTDCDDYDNCEGTKSTKTDESLLGLYLTKKNPTCVTLNWGGTWKTLCK